MMSKKHESRLLNERVVIQTHCGMCIIQGPCGPWYHAGPLNLTIVIMFIIIMNHNDQIKTKDFSARNPSMVQKGGKTMTVSWWKLRQLDGFFQVLLNAVHLSGSRPDKRTMSSIQDSKIIHGYPWLLQFQRCCFQSKQNARSRETPVLIPSLTPCCAKARCKKTPNNDQLTAA